MKGFLHGEGGQVWEQAAREVVESSSLEVFKRHGHSTEGQGHNTDHARTVIRESLALARQLPQADVRMVYTVAAYHDTGLCRDRKTHHLVSGEILAADPVLPRWFTPDEIQTMREAVEDHRASIDHEPRSLYGRIVAEADRIIDPDTTLRRTVQYGLRLAPEADAEWHYTRFCQHLDDKYAPGGKKYVQVGWHKGM